jgi:predicted dehydrogenase
MSDETNYDLKGDSKLPEIPVPELPYAAPRPVNYRPKIGLIGCGGITVHHLEAYRHQGYEVVALCDLREEAAREKRDKYFPQADVFSDYAELLTLKDIEVVDIALHPAPRAAAIEAALKAGKHVLSQKPFVLDLDVGRRLVELAKAKGLQLAVNQNGRWAPYVRTITEAIRQGHLGDIEDVNIRMNWDHTWIKGTAFETIHHVILYDFAIHWIDMVRTFFGNRKALSVYASVSQAPGQEMASPMMANISIAFENGQAVLSFNGHSQVNAEEDIVVLGNKGTVRASGDVCAANSLSLTLTDGQCRPEVEGHWFQNGFQGTMGELLCAIEENREPENSAANNLKSLEMAFAAIESADSGKPVVPGTARQLGDSCKPKA